MHLITGEKVWMPENSPDLACVLDRKQNPPPTLQAFLENQAKVLERLVDEADDAEVQEESLRLEQNLPYEIRTILPAEPLGPGGPMALMISFRNLVDNGHPIREWMDSATEAVTNPQVPMEPEDSAAEWIEELNLGTFLERLLY